MRSAPGRRQRSHSAVARGLSGEARLLCFDEFQVTDVADAMILGRLFEQLLAAGTVIVATSNVAPDRLYEGGLNRQLFLPFIAMIETRLDVMELNGPIDYRLHRLSGHPVYLTPLSPQADAAMDKAWQRLTDYGPGEPMRLTVFGRSLLVPQAARGWRDFPFAIVRETAGRGRLSGNRPPVSHGADRSYSRALGVRARRRAAFCAPDRHAL